MVDGPSAGGPPTSPARFGAARAALFLVLVAGSAGAAYYAVAALPETSPLGLAPDKLVVRWGEVGQGERLTAAFTLTNRYPEPVTIRRTETGCACEQAVVDRAHLLPGERTHVNIRWAVGDRRGPVTDVVWIIHTLPAGDRTGAEPLGRLGLRLEAEVAPDLVYRPDRLEFDAGRPATARVTLSPGRVREFTIDRVFCASKAIRVRQIDSRPEVEVEYVPSGELDRGPGQFVGIEVSGGHERLLRVPVVVQEGP